MSSKNTLRIAAIVITIPFVLLAAMLVFVAGFADGGTLFDRVVLSVLNPLSIIAILVGLSAKRVNRKLERALVGIVGVTLICFVGIFLKIILGFDKGDWFVPLIPTPPLVLYLFYYYHFSYSYCYSKKK